MMFSNMVLSLITKKKILFATMFNWLWCGYSLWYRLSFLTLLSCASSLLWLRTATKSKWPHPNLCCIKTKANWSWSITSFAISWIRWNGPNLKLTILSSCSSKLTIQVRSKSGKALQTSWGISSIICTSRSWINRKASSAW